MKFLLALVTVVLSSQVSHAQIDRSELREVFLAFTATFRQEILKQNEVILYNPMIPGHGDPFDFEYMHAASSSYIDPKTGQKVNYIFFMGGYAAMPEMTLDGAALVICHELGHAIGKGPFKDAVSPPMTIEAESDYFATSQCLRRVFGNLKERPFTLKAQATVEKLCGQAYKSEEDLKYCYRAMAAVETEMNFFRLHPNIRTETSLDKKDPIVAKKIVLHPEYYPSAQCRLDTLVAGVLSEPRPACWWVAPTSTPGSR